MNRQTKNNRKHKQRTSKNKKKNNQIQAKKTNSIKGNRSTNEYLIRTEYKQAESQQHKCKKQATTSTTQTKAIETHGKLKPRNTNT